MPGWVFYYWLHYKNRNLVASIYIPILADLKNRNLNKFLLLIVKLLFLRKVSILVFLNFISCLNFNNLVLFKIFFLHFINHFLYHKHNISMDLILFLQNSSQCGCINIKFLKDFWDQKLFFLINSKKNVVIMLSDQELEKRVR